MQKVTNVESSSNTLAEARERVTNLMNKNKEGKYDFDAELQRAKKEIWQKEQKAYNNHTARKQDILSYIELYHLKRGIDNVNNDLSAIVR